MNTARLLAAVESLDPETLMQNCGPFDGPCTPLLDGPSITPSQIAYFKNAPNYSGAVDPLVADVRAMQVEDEAEITRLILARAAIRDAAALSPEEYDLKRERIAADGHLRVSTLDAERKKLRASAGGNGERLQGAAVLFSEPLPWPEPVDGAAALSGVAEILLCYLHLPDGAADALALWIAHAFVADAFQHSPRLNATAATRGCGKTLLLDVVAAMTPRALRIENLTPAVLFRIIAKDKPTLLVDECDRHLRENVELIGLLNAGFTAGGVVPRCEGDGNEVRLFPVFGPVALSGIGELPGTLRDRALIVNMERAAPGEIRSRFDSRHTERERELKRKLMRWCADKRDDFESADPVMPLAFNRVADVWRPLFALAQVAGGDWPNRAAQAFAILAQADADSEPVGVQLVQDSVATMVAADVPVMSSVALIERLVQLDERPWATWNKGRPISARQIAKILRGFRIKPATHRAGTDVFKGYSRKALNDALRRYTPDLAVTQLQPNSGAASSGFSDGYINSVLPIEKPLQPNAGVACDRVTDKSPQSGTFEDETRAAISAEQGLDL